MGLIIAILTHYSEFYNRSFITKHPYMIILKADLDMALEKLSKEQREAILGYFYKDLNDREIGEQLGIPTRTVSYRRSSGISQLYKILNGKDRKNKCETCIELTKENEKLKKEIDIHIHSYKNLKGKYNNLKEKYDNLKDKVAKTG